MECCVVWGDSEEYVGNLTMYVDAFFAIHQLLTHICGYQVSLELNIMNTERSVPPPVSHGYIIPVEHVRCTSG